MKAPFLRRLVATLAVAAFPLCLPAGVVFEMDRKIDISGVITDEKAKTSVEGAMMRVDFEMNLDTASSSASIFDSAKGETIILVPAEKLACKRMGAFVKGVVDVYRGIQNKNMPNLMSFAVTDVCNAHCGHCSFYEGMADPRRRVMNLDECRQVIRAAQELGVSIINFVGGEPLKRPEILEIVRAVDKDQSATSMFTNGWALPELARGLRQAGLDGIYVSLDSADAAKHDAIRGLHGLFERALRGIEAALKTGMSVGISICLTPERFAAGEFEKMIGFGRKLGVHEVTVFDAMPVGRAKDHPDLMDNEAWKEDLIERSKRYNADDAYPGILIHAYTVSHRSVGCSCGTSYFYVTPYGDVTSCDFNHRGFGNMLEEPLYVIWDRMTSQEAYRQAKWGGCKVKDSQFMEQKMNGCEKMLACTKG